MTDEDTSQRWAQFRWAMVGHIIASPPAQGTLHIEIDRIASLVWKHPLTGEWVQFGYSTVERWFYRARQSPNPIDALRRKIRKDTGNNRAMSAQLLAELEAQYRDHPTWSYQLHAENLTALVNEKPHIGPAPSTSTVRRRMKAYGWRKHPRIRGKKTDGAKRAQHRLDTLEVRSYEVEHVHELWHFDYHVGRRQVVLPDGTWHVPYLLSILDDCCRVVCHIQWYLSESAETLEHGHRQAYQKRGLPRREMSDNGAAMIAEETCNGFMGLSIVHERTLDYSPYQNAKQEVFWGTQIEGRLMPMLEHVEPLTLDFLNHATWAFVEQEYHRKRHKELGCSPLQRAQEAQSVSRPCPNLDMLRLSFTCIKKRTQRRSDGTISIDGTRFEIPNHLRTFDTLWVRYRRWDLSMAYVVDARDHRTVLARIFPINKRRNANGHRRTLAPLSEKPASVKNPSRDPIPPLLRHYMADYAASGLPPAYIPLESSADEGAEGQDHG